jgi:hypothetical protein
MSLETQTAPAPAADNSPLSLDQAAEIIAAKSAPPPKQAKKDKAPAPVAEPVEEIEDDTDQSPEGEGEPVVEDVEDSEADPQAADDGEEAPDTDTLDAEQEQEPDPAQPKLEAPARWEAEDKALFATLPKKAQETILRREKLQQAEVTKAQQKSAETVKAFETRITHLNDLATRIGEQYVEPAQARMKEWQDWFSSSDAQELARTNPGAFLEQQTIYGAERRELNDAIKAKQAAERQAFKDFAEEQARLIPELIPEFADEVEGPKRKTELATYLRDNGFEPDRISGISAKEAQIAWKARKFDSVKDFDALVRDAEAYRKSMKLAKTAPPPKPRPQAGPNAPVAGQGQRLSSSEARLKTLSSKPSLSADEHTELMMLKAKTRK